MNDLQSNLKNDLVSDQRSDIKLLVLDIDGTIAGHSNQVRPAVLAAIKAAQAQGVLVTIATGRMYRSALRFHEQIGGDLPLIAYQGAWIQDPITNKRYLHQPVPVEMAAQLLDYLEQPEFKSRLSIHFYINDELYVREVLPDTKDYAVRSGIPPNAVGDLRSTLDPALDQSPTKILALSEDTQLIDELLVNVRQLYRPEELYLTKSVATFFEMAHPLVNKGLAVDYLARELLQIAPEQVMTVGDNFNDVEMLQYAGIGVAMGDAPPEVKAIANWVAPSVEDDGVAAAIDRFILK
jgi:Cof subfamily protein (haloacid dehalogenase superfamily)